MQPLTEIPVIICDRTVSTMENGILGPEYLFNAGTGIWARTDYAGIQYNDGDEAEQRIATIVRNASNITVFSVELRAHCTDWPSLYHLSSARANILRPFSGELRGDVLEIGAGCGAITRYLGESGAYVLALEGSPRRAAIARSRTRDLENVTVVAEKFDQFKCNHRFDFVTLIGVLEYANLFTPGENPVQRMLQHVRSLLKPEGKLIVAIENQLGLKYFAGAPEDHLGEPMYGIEGRYAAEQPQTFGRKALTNLMQDAGFATIECLAPFPDYKLPVSILTEEGLTSEKFDGAALAWQSVRRDPQLPAITNFSLELAWPEIFRNGLAMDMANSFLIAASPLQQKIIKPGILGYHYSTNRIGRYCKEAIFAQFDDSKLGVHYRMLSDFKDDAKAHGIVAFKHPGKSVYSEGKPLSLELLKIITGEGWSLQEVGKFIQRYINFLSLIAAQKGHGIAISHITDKLPGVFFDIVPQNIIVNDAGQPLVIDAEWSLNDDIELGWLLFRALMLLIESGVSFGTNSENKFFLRGTFIKSSLRSAGYSGTDEDLYRYLRLEAAVQQYVTGFKSEGLSGLWLTQSLSTYSVINKALAERDERIRQLNRALVEREEKIAGLQSQIKKIYASSSWRLTSPVRAAKSTLTGLRTSKSDGSGFFNSIRSRNLLRRAYRKLPLPLSVKQQLKRIYIQRSSLWKVRNREVFQTDQHQEALLLITASAKQYNPENRWVLVVDFRIPTPDRDSGSVRMSAILLLLKRMEYRITFISDSEEQLPDYQMMLERQDITVLLGYHAARQHLAVEGGKYHFALLSRPEVAFQYLPYIRACALYAFVIYDTVDLHWVRFEREMEVSGNQTLLDATAHFRRVELFNTACADLTLAITDEEKDRLLLGEKRMLR